MKYEITLSGQLPATAKIEVEAPNRDEAEILALDNFLDASWDGADYSVPEGATIEIVNVDEVA